MRHVDREIASVGDLVEGLKADNVDGSSTWYRGQASSAWPLVPSIGRNPAHIAAELTSIKRFQQDAWSHLQPRPAAEWEWITTMQHYRAKTRLLDWSENPLVALFFSVQFPEEDAFDGAVWIMDPIALNRFSGHRRAFDKDILAFSDTELESYLPDQVSARKANLDPIAVIGPRNTPRMVAQSGTFTIMHAEPRPVEGVGDATHIWRYLVRSANKANVRRELGLIGVQEYSLFPELDRVAGIAKGLFA